MNNIQDLELNLESATQRADAAERKLGEALQHICKVCDEVKRGTAVGRTLAIQSAMTFASASAEPAECPACSGSRVVATTEKDHNGDAIEMRCPDCEPAKGGDGE